MRNEEHFRQNSAFILLRGVLVVIVSTSRDDQAIAMRWPPSDQRDICKSSPDEFSFIHAARSPCDHPQGISRWPNGERLISVRSAAGFFQLNFGRWPTGRRQRAGRHPAGRHRMSEWPQTSGGHPPNFNCELNLPGHRRMSAG